MMIMVLANQQNKSVVSNRSTLNCITNLFPYVYLTDTFRSIGSFLALLWVTNLALWLQQDGKSSVHVFLSECDALQSRINETRHFERQESIDKSAGARLVRN